MTPFILLVVTWLNGPFSPSHHVSNKCQLMSAKANFCPDLRVEFFCLWQFFWLMESTAAPGPDFEAHEALFLLSTLSWWRAFDLGAFFGSLREDHSHADRLKRVVTKVSLQNWVVLAILSKPWWWWPSCIVRILPRSPGFDSCWHNWITRALCFKNLSVSVFSRDEILEKQLTLAVLFGEKRNLN